MVASWLCDGSLMVVSWSNHGYQNKKIRYFSKLDDDDEEGGFFSGILDGDDDDESEEEVEADALETDDGDYTGFSFLDEALGGTKKPARQSIVNTTVANITITSTKIPKTKQKDEDDDVSLGFFL